MTEARPSRVQELAEKSYDRNDPTGWFEELYLAASGDESAIPWAKLEVNPNLTSWIEKYNLQGRGKTALVVGCGLGDDAEALAELGFEVTGFDISPTAIAWCRQRFPDTRVNYIIDDLLQLSTIAENEYNFILESYTLQALPAAVRPQGMETIARLLAPNGTLLVICRGRNGDESATSLPYPLTKEELSYFEELDLKRVELEDYIYPENSSIRRFRIEYTRTSGNRK